MCIRDREKYGPDSYKPVNRKKPGGTTHAMLCGKEVIDGPFAVINADDFYGKEAFESLASFFRNAPAHHHAMVGYTLQNVLSEHGSVSRGVATPDADGYLQSMKAVSYTHLDVYKRQVCNNVKPVPCVNNPKRKSG